MRRGQRMVRYLTGAWDECERLTAEDPELLITLAAAELATEGLAVPIARGRSVAAKRLRQLVAFAGVDRYLDKDVAAWEAELATWQGDLERAKSAIQRALAALDAIEPVHRAWDTTWVCMKGLTVEAERAAQARVAGEAAVLDDAMASGDGLLERARAAAMQHPQPALAHGVRLRGWQATAEADGPACRDDLTQSYGSWQSRRSPTATCTRWPAVSGGWPRHCLASATGNQRSRRGGQPTKRRCN